MKYFKPELLARCRSLDDDKAEAAAARWERAVAAYNLKLSAIRRELPAGARFILDHFSLHDARLFGITLSQSKPWVSLFVRLEGIPSRLGNDWELKYVLAKGPKHRQFSIDRLQKNTKILARIQYDEFAKVAVYPEKVFAHALLLADGSELRIRFVGLRVQLLQRAIFPSTEPAGLEAR